MNEDKVIKEEVLESEEVLDSEGKSPKGKSKFWHVIKIILLVITAPVWLPWKILFVRRKDRKFKDMSMGIKIFRIVRSPITIPLKFCIFLLIIGLEVFIGYKIRFSPVTYPITRASVHNYYLQKSNKSLAGISDVSAAELSNHYDEFKTAFDYIDKWDLDAKNKMYVVLDADITKFVFQSINDKSVSYILNRFNSELQLREDICMVAKNVNKTLNRAIKEFPESVPYAEDFDMFLGPATSIGGMIDYRQALDIAWSGVNAMINTNILEVSESDYDYYEPEEYDLIITTIIYYSKGNSIKDTYEYLNDHYETIERNHPNTNTNNDVVSSQSSNVISITR